MRIDYRILWLDDNIKAFIEDGYVEELENILINKGFDPKIEKTSTVDEFYNLVRNKEYDLILIDYHMNQENGDKVINTIRAGDYSILTEILFYTAKADLTDVGRIDRVSFLETESSKSHHETVVKRAGELIDLTIKKFQNIIYMRGMVMHETAALDMKMLDIIEEYFADESNSHNKDEVMQKIFDYLIENHKKNLAKIEECQKENNLLKIVKKPLFGSNVKLKTLTRILTIRKETNFLGEEQDNNSYLKDIIQRRNKFAHARLKKDQEGNHYFESLSPNSEKIRFDQELCQEMRENIRKYNQDLDKMLENLQETH